VHVAPASAAANSAMRATATVDKKVMNILFSILSLLSIWIKVKPFLALP
jgi:hypothetical protein